MAKFLSALLFAASLIVAAPVSHAAQLTSIKVTESGSLPKIQPGWRVPNDRGQVFYLQRSTNSNTVVYRANFDGNGNLKSKDPAGVYWRRYNTDGAAKGLKRIEYLAYGLRTKKRGNGEYTVTLRQLPQLPMILRQTGKNKAELLVNIRGQMVRAVYAYATIEGSGISQRVAGFSIHGISLSTGRAVSETFAVKGGGISQ